MLRPLHSVLTIALDKKAERSAGGIVIPDTNTASVRTGIVRAVGPGRRLENGDFDTPLIKVGDHVLIGVQLDRTGTAGNLGAFTDEDGTQVVIVNYHDVWGIFEK